MLLRRCMVFFMGVMMCFALACQALAEDVFVTKSGKKYHHANSRFIKNRDVTKYTREEAEAKGYKPSRDYLKYIESLDDQDKAAKESDSE